MSSTEDIPAHALTGRLFDEVLIPMAERLRAEGRLPFSSAPDNTRQTYYVPRSTRRMTKEEFSFPSVVGMNELEERLATLWRAAGWPELAAVARLVADAARDAQTLGDDDAEISGTSYVMF